MRRGRIVSGAQFKLYFHVEENNERLNSSWGSATEVAAEKVNLRRAERRAIRTGTRYVENDGCPGKGHVKLRAP